MQLMTIDDLNGHWQTKDGQCHIWIRKDEQHVQLYANQKLLVNETLAFKYLDHENMWIISESVLLFMIFPDDNSIMVAISKLRGKISDGENDYIHTIRGLGYRMEEK